MTLHNSTESYQNNKTNISTYILGIMAILLSSYFIFMTAVQIRAHYKLALQNAIMKGNTNRIKQLIADGHNVNAEGRYGYTMLTCIIHYGLKSGKLLKTPRQIYQKQYAMLEILIDNGANVNALDRYARAPLLLATSPEPFNYSVLMATMKERRQLVEMLIAKGANVNIKDYSGNTPLHYTVHVAVYTGNTGIVKVLIENGANINAKNKRGETPLKLALESSSSSEEILELLRRHGAKE